MATRRGASGGDLDAVEHVRSKLAQMSARYGNLKGCPWPEQLERFDAGEPILLRSWELPGVPRHYGLGMDDHVWLDRFGRLALDDPEDMPPPHIVQPNPEES